MKRLNAEEAKRDRLIVALSFYILLYVHSEGKGTNESKRAFALPLKNYIKAKVHQRNTFFVVVFS